MTYNLSELFERVVDTVPADRTALVCGDTRLTYAELDARANRLAHHLAQAGVGPGDHVGLQLQNGNEYVEGMLAAYKLRAVPININYRYVERELAYLFDNADLVALLSHREFGPRIAAVDADLPKLRHHLVVDDGSDADHVEHAVPYEEALAGASPDRDFAGRTSDDVYIAYTGGTTGMPKGVMWRHEDIFFVSMGGGDPTTLEGPITDPDQLRDRVAANTPGVAFHTPPLMHVSAQWGSFQAFFGGSTVVLSTPGPFDPVEVLDTIQREGVQIMTLVGDAMARPLIDTYAAGPDRWDVSTLFVFASGGAMLSATTKARIAQALPNVIVVDGLGSSETGVQGTQVGATEGTSPRFAVGPNTIVVDDDMTPIEPGSGVIGRVATTGRIPLGYHKDEEKTRATFVEAEGKRWVLSGDSATVEEDGTITLLGRGSVSINTGGEKVYPEEVENVLKAHPTVEDVLVVGVPDERWGNRVVAVVQPRAGTKPELDDLRDHARAELAGYKVPRGLVVVDRVERGPNGKPDYGWAQEVAREAEDQAGAG